jgi:hypothetical protein
MVSVARTVQMLENNLALWRLKLLERLERLERLKPKNPEEDHA